MRQIPARIWPRPTLGCQKILCQWSGHHDPHPYPHRHHLHYLLKAVCKNSTASLYLSRLNWAPVKFCFLHLTDLTANRINRLFGALVASLTDHITLSLAKTMILIMSVQFFSWSISDRFLLNLLFWYEIISVSTSHLESASLSFLPKYLSWSLHWFILHIGSHFHFRIKMTEKCGATRFMGSWDMKSTCASAAVGQLPHLTPIWAASLKRQWN